LDLQALGALEDQGGVALIPLAHVLVAGTVAGDVTKVEAGVGGLYELVKTPNIRTD
jgi:hypothetical protein